MATQIREEFVFCPDCGDLVDPVGLRHHQAEAHTRAAVAVVTAVTRESPIERRSIAGLPWPLYCRRHPDLVATHNETLRISFCSVCGLTADLIPPRGSRFAL